MSDEATNAAEKGRDEGDTAVTEPIVNTDVVTPSAILQGRNRHASACLVS